jgi:hypothetical protein
MLVFEAVGFQVVPLHNSVCHVFSIGSTCETDIKPPLLPAVIVLNQTYKSHDAVSKQMVYRNDIMLVHAETLC